jgi:hypothetical protein
MKYKRPLQHSSGPRRALITAVIGVAILGAAAYAETTWLNAYRTSSESQDSSPTTQPTPTTSTPTTTKPSSGSTTSGGSLAAITTTGSYAVLAWNDLGMHCVDGKDYSIMSILPPYNNLHAQVINKSTGKQVISGVTVTYQSMADPSGSKNTISSTKTNFWTYVQSLYGASPKPDYGLNLYDTVSNRTPGTTAQPMKYNTTLARYEAEGLPITPYDDAGNKNYYPMVKVAVKDSTGKQVASTQTVLPVSDELNCMACHASNSGNAAAMPPIQGWAKYQLIDPEKDWKKNVLRLHDDKLAGNAVYQAALQKLENTSTPVGLARRADSGSPALCSSCHGSNALNSPGFTLTVNGSQATVSALTSALHSSHSKVMYPGKNTTLDGLGNRDSCYLCHPGSTTKCLRGAMSEVAGLDCQSCHGNMTAVGQKTRQGWLEEPNCQACHQNGQRYISAVTDVTTGALRQVSDTRFATTLDVPAKGYSLFRFSTGHGKTQCEACHGSTHAEYSSANNAWSSSHDNDILQSKSLQGYAGAIQECTVCHKTVPLTGNGGPHGMHTIGQTWVTQHHDLIGSSGGLASCQYCHDARTSNGTFSNTYRGTPLSTIKVAKTFTVDDGRTKTFSAGTKVGCYDCHNGPKGD